MTPSDQKIAADMREFLISELDTDDDFDDSDLLVEEGLVDSLGLLETVRFIEDTYGVEVSDLDVTLDNFGSVKTMVPFIQQLVGD